jgi:2-methylisocitrate lyase-like PEP mutase family enzyme
MSLTSPGKALRAVFDSPETALVPFGALPLHAQMAQHAGFDAFQLSGGMSAWWQGVSDTGWLTLTEVVEHAKRTARAADIPIYCDADTAFGAPINVQRTVSEFIDAGVAGIHIEDQREPKKSGGVAGIELVSDAEAIGRLNAAVDARDKLDRDFVIVARTDGYGAAGGGVDEAIRRAQLYKAETGADVIFYEGLETWEEIETALRETPGPAYAIPHRNAGPTPSVAELTRMGQSIQIVPFLLPGVHEVWNLLRAVAESGELTPVDDYRAHVDSFRGTDAWVGAGEALLALTYDDVAELEARLAPAPARAVTAGESA